MGRILLSEGLIIAAALLCDINSWGHQFLMDDAELIVRNPTIQSPSHILQIFTSSFVRFSAGLGGLYRPLTGLTLAINYWISGPQPDSFHLLNRLVHVLIGLGVFWTIRLLIPRPPHAALFTALLFAVHPIQTEAITYISGRADALAMLFFVLAWYYFVRLRQSDSFSPKSYSFSLAFYLLGMLSKENALTWLGVAFLTELVYFSQGNVGKFFGQMRRNFWKLYAGYFLVTLAFLTIRFAVLKESAAITTRFFVENPLAYVPTAVRLMTALKIFFGCMGLFFWPASFSPDYSYNQIPLLTHWSRPVALFVLLMTLFFVTALIWSYRRFPHFFFGLGFFAVTYSIIGNFIVPIGTIRADRLLYLPSLGLSLLVGVALANLEQTFRASGAKKAIRVAVTLILLLLATRTIIRNRDWRDQFTLYLQALHTSPNSVKVHTYMGGAYVARNELDKGIEEYRIAESIDPNFFELLTNLGVALLKKGRTDEAIADFHRALALRPDKADIVRIDLGMALRTKGDLAGAMEQYDKVIQQFPSSAAAHFNKGNALYAQGNIPAAISEYNQALAIDPHLAEARTNLGILLQKAQPAGSPQSIP